MNANRLTMVLVAGAILLAVAMIGPGRAANQTTTGPNTVAVVDVQQAFNDLDEKIAIEADQQQTLDEIQSKRKLRSDEIEQFQEDLKILSPGNEYNKVEEKIFFKAAQLEAWLKLQQKKLLTTRAIRYQAVRKKMISTVETLAKNQNIDIVLNKESKIPLPSGQQGRTNEVNVITVLWAADPLDLTDQVVQRMNNDWQAP